MSECTVHEQFLKGYAEGREIADRYYRERSSLFSRRRSDIELTGLERLNLRRAIEREMEHLTSTYEDNYPDCPKCARRYKADIAERLSVLEAAASKLGVRVDPEDDWRHVLTAASGG